MYRYGQASFCRQRREHHIATRLVADSIHGRTASLRPLPGFFEATEVRLTCRHCEVPRSDEVVARNVSVSSDVTQDHNLSDLK